MIGQGWGQDAGGAGSVCNGSHGGGDVLMRKPSWLALRCGGKQPSDRGETAV